MATVYRHLRNDTGTPFYVGASKTTKRAYEKGKRRPSQWHDIVNAHGYTVDIIYEGISIDEAFKIEQYLIGFYGRKDLGKGGLVNMTDGGEGILGLKHTKETIAKMRKPKSEEWKAKMVATRKANDSYRHSEEWKAKMSATKKGKPKSEETKAKMRKPKSEEHKANMRKAAKLRWESRAGLQKRAEMSELLTNYHKSINN